MYFSTNALQRPHIAAHWAELWTRREMFNVNHANMVDRFRHLLNPADLSANTLNRGALQANAVNGFTREFWAELDREVISSRESIEGMEILEDLLGIQTTVPIGKTAKLYNIGVSAIADDVSISMDGQAPYSFDHTAYDSDGDPIPVFTAGFGANWRDVAGLNSVGIDILGDSQTAKMIKYNRRLVDYLLNGSDRIRVSGYNGQGLKNHRNTIKMDLDASGANINLTTAGFDALLQFFTTGAFGQMRRANKVTAYDVMWVSPEIMANLNKPYLISINNSNTLVSGQTLQTALAQFMGVRSIRETYALSGNEFLAYERRRDVLTPLVGMTTGIVPLPRFMPQENYNFQIMGAMGVQVKKTDSGRSGVVYGSNIS